MRKQTFQHAEIRDENDNIVNNGAYGKNTALSNKQNDGWVDYVMNNLEYLYEQKSSVDTSNFVSRLEEIKNRLDTIEDIACTPTGSLVTYDLQEGVLGTIPERIQVIKVSCIESPKDFVFCGMRTQARELSFYLGQTESGFCLKLSNKNTRIETVTVSVNTMPHFKIEWSYEINRQTPDMFFN